MTLQLYSQDLVLQQVLDQNNIVRLPLDREYTIKVSDTTYRSGIYNLTDSTLSIVCWKDTGKDSAYYYPNYFKGRDTTIIRRVFVEDTIAILYSNIQYIQKDWLKNKRWLEPFGWMGVGAILGIGLFPVAAIEDGTKGVKDLAIIEGILIGGFGSALFIATRKTTYDLRNKWKIAIEHK